MKKFRIYLDKDKETAWLNEMSAQGWAAKGFFAGFYQFEACEKGEYVYQIDFGTKLFAASEDYREFMQEAGIELVQTWGYWIILRKKAAEGKFELYTDVPSRLAHYKKNRRMFKVVTVFELVCMLFELYLGFVNGVRLGLVSALLLGAIFVACMNMVIQLNDRIGLLQEQMDGIGRVRKRRTVSGLIVSGLLLNSLAIMIEDAAVHPVKWVLQIAAILLMLCGLVQTCRSRK